MTQWNSENTGQVCRACGKEFQHSKCIRCGAPAIANRGFVCALHTADAVKEVS